MTKLPAGCRCSRLSVYPKNWLTDPSSVTRDWYIKYRFYDPRHTHHKQVVLKEGINGHTDHTARVRYTQQLLRDTLQQLKEGFNPYPYHSTTTSELSLAPALQLALREVEVSAHTREDMTSVLKYFLQAALRLGMTDMMLSSVRSKHVKLILKECYRRKTFTDNTHNHYRKYIRILFNYLYKHLELIDQNPADNVAIKQTEPTIPTLLDAEQRKQIKSMLRQKKYANFRRFLQIFFASGTRRCELMLVQKEHVNLPAQIFSVKVRKGNKTRVVEKVITDAVLPLWKQLIKEARAGQYLFSVGLKPGKKPIRPEQSTRRWRRHIKDKLGIEINMYHLKHLFSDLVAQKLGLRAAAAHNSHTTTAVTEKHYAVGEKLRRQKTMKRVRIQF